MKRIIPNAVHFIMAVFLWLLLFIFTAWLISNVKLFILMLAVLLIILIGFVIGMRLKKQGGIESEEGQ